MWFETKGSQGATQYQLSCPQLPLSASLPGPWAATPLSYVPIPLHFPGWQANGILRTFEPDFFCVAKRIQDSSVLLD